MLGTLTSRNDRSRTSPSSTRPERPPFVRKKKAPAASTNLAMPIGTRLYKVPCQPTINLLQLSAGIRGTCSFRFDVQVRQACRGHHSDHAAQSQDPSNLLTREPASCRSGRRSTRIWAAAGTPARCSAQMTRRQSRRAEPQTHWCPTIATLQLSVCRPFTIQRGPCTTHSRVSMNKVPYMRRLPHSCMTVRNRWSH